jgi:alkylhydroperoxidase family enzyme
MPWIPWIRIEALDTEREEAKALYEKTANPLTKKISDLTRLTSLTPQVSERIDELCKSVYKNATGLSAREKEIAALVTSSLNGCVH